MRKIPLSETSVIAVWLTREHGLVRTAARGARKPGSPFAGKLDLFYRAEISVARSKRGDLHTLREVQLLDALPGLRQDYQRVQLAAYFIELLEIAMEPDHPEPELYDLFLRALTYLEGQSATRRAMAHFERELVRLLGLGSAEDEVGDTLEHSLSQGGNRRAIRVFNQAYHRLPHDSGELWRSLPPG